MFRVLIHVFILMFCVLHLLAKLNIVCMNVSMLCLLTLVCLFSNYVMLFDLSIGDYHDDQ